MTLTNETIEKINEEYSQWEKQQYAEFDLEHRQKLGMFYTPPALTVKMLEKFKDMDGTFLDPTCGAGGLIAAAIIAGADPKKCYGIELSDEIVDIARNRLAKLGVPRWNIKQGDALKSESYDFDESLRDKDTLYFDIFDKGCNKIEIVLELNIEGKTTIYRHLVDLVEDTTISNKLEKIFKIFSIATARHFSVLTTNSKITTRLLNILFKKYINKSIELEDVYEL